ncbi:MAG: 50S ribosomal protein L25 [Candidatus Brennerbacteria bacterium]
MTELKVQTRDALGKKTKVLRREGFVPAEVYGRGTENLHVSVSLKEFVALYRTAGSHTVITLVAGEHKIPAVIAEVAKNPLTDEILAIDFHAIKKGEKVHAKVPVVFVGTAPATKEGFVVVEVVREIEIEALPEDLLHRIEVSVEKLEKPGDSVAIKDLSIPASVKLHIPADAVLATVREHVKEAAPEPAPAATPAEGAPVEGEAAVPAETPAEPEKKEKK